jgi:hypothetical protein
VTSFRDVGVAAAVADGFEAVAAQELDTER